MVDEPKAGDVSLRDLKVDIKDKPDVTEKRGRGRPKGAKKKEKLTLDAAKKLPMAVAIDGFTANLVNKAFLKDKEKINTEEVGLGASLMLVVDYYASDLPAHPVFILIGAMSALGFKVASKKKLPAVAQ